MSIFTKTLTDKSQLAIETLFARLQHLPYAIWLDSNSTNHVDSRFDIVAIEPVITLETSQGKTKVHDKITEHVQYSVADPLTLVDHYLKSHCESVVNESELPFSGGVLGYFSYDLGRYFERLPATSKRDIDLPDMAVGIYRHALIFDRALKTYTLVSQDDNLAELESQYFPDLPAVEQQDGFKLTSSWQANMNAQQYRDKFARVQEYLLSGDCYQINLTQRFEAEYKGSEYQAYLALRESNLAPFSAFIRLPQGCILSVSPERFLQLQDSKVQTKPIKGTRPRGKTTESDEKLASELKHASKDQAENLMIVDLLRNDISKNCVPGSVKVPKLFAIESFPAVHHLVSTVVGELAEDNSAMDLLRGCFPGGSITGAPKIRAMEIIEELEPNRRSVYCGSIGYVSACGKMDTSITIRTLIANEQTLYCWAGGGVVADSQVDSEYQETFDKVNKILPVLEKL
ncbi:aminodeoxychorismate synthase component I [Thalassotalea sp. PS06]|uniref:aminodeoxychorismate synthase component I n=1 Tax=Thalassotalea sp. PS06 TaxID=2594005 RepID=UPI0011640FE8|nr:aminodeoxychorismate synthase component I [Thalassotalea sp. PS06]QDP01640.1 aminodeoxychorismate synthase component I [Thalassotalea sp. PS06]